MDLHRLNLLLLAAAIAPGFASAQVAGGSISGIVRDAKHHPVASAEITITNLATGLVRKSFTNGSGIYTVPNLIPGEYSASASAEGFSTLVNQGIQVTVGAEVQIGLELKPGDLADVVATRSGAPGVELTLSSLSAVADQRTVRELPLNGRDWTTLATLQPGVDTVRTQPVQAISNQRPNRGPGVQLSIDGARPQWNNYRVDGISINDYSNGGPGNVLGTNFGVDAIQEFSVITSNALAEYGKAGGGIVNAATRSGSDSIHASAYEFLRNSALDARNHFDSPVKIPPFKQNQYGGTASGPLSRGRKRGKTFVFGDYERLSQNVGLPQVDVVPSANARKGLLVGGPVVVDPAIAPYLAFYPLPDAASSGDTGTYTFNSQQLTAENFFTGRVDQKFSALDTLSASYFFDSSQKTGPDALDVKNTAAISKRQLISVNETHLFTPGFLDSIRLGYSRVVSVSPTTVGAINPAASDTSLGFVPGLTAGLITVPGIAAFPGGLGAVGEYDFHFNSYQAYDDAMWTRGSHQVKFGVSLERVQDNQIGKANPNGQYIFGSLAGFLTNQPLSFNAPLGGAITPRDLRTSLPAFYVSDDWRVRSNLTLNLGVRYEMATVLSETANRLAVLHNFTDAQATLGSPYFANPSKLNIAPRAGFSWDPFGHSTTVLRGGFGLYDVLALPYEFEVNSILSAPFFDQGNVTSLAIGSFPKQAFGQLTANKLRYSYIQPNPSRNYAMQWNLNVQRQFGRDYTATLAYAGAHGVHNLFRDDDANIVLPTLTSSGYQWPNPHGTGTRINPNVGQVTALWWTGSSVYHALQAEMVKRYGHGLQFGASYTWAKGIDDGSASIAGDQFSNSVSSLPFFDSRLRRGLSDFDQKNGLALNALWNIPGPHGNSWRSEAVRGWTFGNILQMASGLPFTPVMAGDPLGLRSADTFAFPDRLHGSGCESGINPGNPKAYIKVSCFAFPSSGTLLGNARRNSLIGPGVAELDSSLMKETHLSPRMETLVAQFRLEAFNALNRSNYEPPLSNRSLFSATGAPVATAGLITSTSTTSRQIQVAVKLIY